jgi:WD40 repeat protein
MVADTKIDVIKKVQYADEPQFVQPVLQPLLKLNGHSDPVMAGDWLYGGQQIITVSWDRTANLFDAESGKVLKTLSGSFLFCFCHIFKFSLTYYHSKN